MKLLLPSEHYLRLAVMVPSFHCILGFHAGCLGVVLDPHLCNQSVVAVSGGVFFGLLVFFCFDPMHDTDWSVIARLTFPFCCYFKGSIKSNSFQYTSEVFFLCKTTADKCTIHYFTPQNELLTGS